MSKGQDGIFVMHDVNITLPNANTAIKIIPIGDVHRFSNLCDVERWRDFLKKARKQDDEFTYYIGMGDLDDICSSSERELLGNPKLHDSTKKKLSKWAQRDMGRLINELEFTRGKWLGMAQGNHFWYYEGEKDENGKALPPQTSTQVMANAMGCPWLGDVFHIRLHIGWKHKTCSTSLDIVGSHGKAGGQLLGTKINQVEKLRDIFPMKDIYMYGHDHSKGAWPATVLEVCSGKGGGTFVKQKRQWFARTGSFLRGYVDGEASYIAQRLYAPSDLGIIKFICQPKRDRRGGGDTMYMDIHCLV